MFELVAMTEVIAEARVFSCPNVFSALFSARSAVSLAKDWNCVQKVGIRLIAKLSRGSKDRKMKGNVVKTK